MKSLIINNKIYGRTRITQPVLIELIKSKSLQRLKKIDQLGAWHLHRNKPKKFTRYQHSIGVLLLLKKFNAPPEEQIAGLLHDISHTAFSHVADNIFGSTEKQDYQDNKLVRAFELQGINKILRKHRIDPDRILNFDNFPLLEKELPELCADRIDYALQDPFGQKMSKIKPQSFLKNLTVQKNKFVFINQIWAKKFAELYFKINKTVWCTPLQGSLYQILGEALKLGLDKKIISKKDLFTTDDFVLNKLKKTKDREILKKINLVKTLEIKTVGPAQADLCLKSKNRIVDPNFLKDGRLIRLSSTDKQYRKKIAAEKERSRQGFYVKIINH